MEPKTNKEPTPWRDAYEIGVATKILSPGGTLAPVIAVPKGIELKTLTEHKLPAPLLAYIQATVGLQDLNSFCRYVNRYKTDRTMIGCDGQIVRAALDYHAPATRPARNAHFANFTLKTSEAYEAWKKIHDTPMSQEAFALFLEERAAEVVWPGSAEIMEIVLTLEAKTTVQFNNATRLNNGTVSLKWDESTETRAGAKGEMEVPSSLKLELPLFKFGENVGIEAKLRTIVRSGGVTFIVRLMGLEKAMDNAVASMIAKIEAETGIVPLRGNL